MLEQHEAPLRGQRSADFAEQADVILGRDVMEHAGREDEVEGSGIERQGLAIIAHRIDRADRPRLAMAERA